MVIVILSKVGAETTIPDLSKGITLEHCSRPWPPMSVQVTVVLGIYPEVEFLDYRVILLFSF